MINNAHLNLIFLILILAVSIYMYQGTNAPWLSLWGGIVSALLVVIIQYLFSWKMHVEKEKLAELGLKKVLKHKREKEYYGKLIKGAKNKVYLMGHTASHFLDDFANELGSHDETAVLYDALRKPSMRVKFLFPESNQLSPEAKAQRNESEKKLKSLSSEFENFSYKYFAHQEAHSIFVADDDVVIGPFFTGLPSMDTPALHVRADSHYAKKYLDYFDAEWDEATQK